MTSEALNARVRSLAAAVVDDPRWLAECDDLGVDVLGMILYGYSLGVGRLVMLLEMNDIAEAVVVSLVSPIGAARQWSEGLVAEAASSAFDRVRSPTNFELVGVGHSYCGASASHAELVENVFANISAQRGKLTSTG